MGFIITLLGMYFGLIGAGAAVFGNPGEGLGHAGFGLVLCYVAHRLEKGR